MRLNKGTSRRGPVLGATTSHKLFREVRSAPNFLNCARPEELKISRTSTTKTSRSFCLKLFSIALFQSPGKRLVDKMRVDLFCPLSGTLYVYFID